MRKTALVNYRWSFEFRMPKATISCVVRVIQCPRFECTMHANVRNRNKISHKLNETREHFKISNISDSNYIHMEKIDAEHLDTHTLVRIPVALLYRVS